MTRRNRCFYCFKIHDKYTDEHIVPKWILRRFDLFNKKFNLPNGTFYTYSRYTIDCSFECNQTLNKEFEIPISNLFSKGFSGFVKYLEEYGNDKIFLWLCLIFLKIHFKDDSLEMHLDKRKERVTISDAFEYDFSIFHHMYCLARSPYSRTEIGNFSIGSMFVVPISEGSISDGFDFLDISVARTLGIVIGDIGLIAVIGDCGAVQFAMREEF